MKRLILLAAAALQMLACGLLGSQTPAAPTATVWPTSTAVPPVNLTPAQIVAVNTLSDSLHLPIDQIAIISTQTVDWPDTCLAVIHAGLGCTPAVTPGYRIVLEANQVRYEYRLNSNDLTHVTGATQALTWRQSGDNGACQSLDVYVTGEVFASACGKAPFPKTKLTLDEMLQVASWVRTLGPFTATAGNPAATLSFMGAGSQPASQADRQALFDFAQTLFDKNKPCC